MRRRGDERRGGRTRIVIVGSGFGGAYCARALERLVSADDVEIVLFDRNNYFIFYPLLVEAGTGSLEPRHVVVSIRAFLGWSEFRMAEVTEIDTARRTVTYRLAGRGADLSIDFDHLVLALGSVTRLPPIPGLHDFGLQMKELSDAVALRDRAIRMLELADSTEDPRERRALLHLVVVGGNFTGVEVAGEFDVFLRDAARRYRNLRREDSHVTLVEIAERILPALDPELSEYAAREMRRRGITVRLRSSVREIHDDHVILESGARLEARTVIWCAGIAPTPVARALPVPVDDLGYILCEGDLRVRGFDCVWAIGDCAVSPGPDGRPYPATAQHALRQGRHLAWNLARVLEGRSTRRFDYSTKGALVALGCRTGVAKVFGLKVSGFAAWFLWRTFYLFQMPGWARRLRVALDWTMDLLFPRDYVQLGVHRGERPKRV